MSLVLFLLIVGFSGCLGAPERRFIFFGNHGGGGGGDPSQGTGGGGFQNPFHFGSHSNTGGLHACTPTHSICSLQCPNGFMTGAGGTCYFCACANAGTGATQTPVPDTTKSAVLTSGGGGGGGLSHLPGGGGGFQSPFHFGSHSNTGGLHPCTPTHSICSLTCSDGLMTDAGGTCYYCMCAQSRTGAVTPTQMTIPDTTKVISSTQAIGNLTSGNSCEEAAMVCTLKCGAGGYLIDPGDCTFCMCKSNIGQTM